VNAKQRRKHRRANPHLYWTQEEIDSAKKEAVELEQIFGGRHG
jgi:hypothetical protein